MTVSGTFSTTRISAERLVVSYDHTQALDLKELQVCGRNIAIVGHNGAGKSTLIKCILGLLPQVSGTLQITQQYPDRELPLRPTDHMAFCPETGAVFGDISVESYVQFWCRLRFRDHRYYRRQGAWCIEKLNLAPLLPKLGRELSKGQRRRVQTAIGFLIEPRLFLFDEPFDGLDVQKSSELAEIMVERSPYTSFVISSHRMDVIERVCDAAIVLQEGKLVASGAVLDVSRSLCGSCFHISRINNPLETAFALRREFPSAIVNQHGDQLSFTGPAQDSGELQRIVSAIDQNGATVQPAEPTLSDAMSYHLKIVAH